MPATFAIQKRSPEDRPFRKNDNFVDAGLILRITTDGITQAIPVGRTRPRIKAGSSIYFVGVIERPTDAFPTPLVSCSESGFSTTYTPFTDSQWLTVDPDVETLFPSIAEALSSLCGAYLTRRLPMGGKPVLNEAMTRAGFSVSSIKFTDAAVVFTIWHKENDSKHSAGSRSCSARYDIHEDRLTFLRQLDAAKRGYIKSATQYAKDAMKDATPASSLFTEEALAYFKAKALTKALAQ